jgi:hypothetical protein
MNTTRTVTPALIFVCLSGSALAQDPTHSDGDKYKLVLDNEQVRVLSYTDQPGDKTHLHRHPAFVVVALAPFKRKIALGDGRVMAREFAAGDVLFSQGESHIGENVGSTPTRVILIELKSPRP